MGGALLRPKTSRFRSAIIRLRNLPRGTGRKMAISIPRRQFIAALGGAAAWPLAARGQQGDRVRRIGLLIPYDENELTKTQVSAFTQALAGLGWTDGRNVRMDLHYGSGDSNRIRAFAQELVGLQPDIILAGGDPATVAVQRETRTIPIVFAGVTDPVACASSRG